MAKDMNDSLKQYIESEFRKTHTLTLARVETYNEDLREATVKPLIMQKMAGQDYTPIAPIPATPHLMHRYKNELGVERWEVPVYKAGDVVLIAIVERAMDDSLSGSIAPPASTRRHDLTDSIILGVIA